MAWARVDLELGAGCVGWMLAGGCATRRYASGLRSGCCGGCGWVVVGDQDALTYGTGGELAEELSDGLGVLRAGSRGRSDVEPWRLPWLSQKWAVPETSDVTLDVGMVRRMRMFWRLD